MGWLQDRRDRRERREQEAREERQRYREEEERFYRRYRHARTEFTEGEMSEGEFLDFFHGLVVRQPIAPIFDSVLYLAREYHSVMQERDQNAQ